MRLWDDFEYSFFGPVADFLLAIIVVGAIVALFIPVLMILRIIIMFLFPIAILAFIAYKICEWTWPNKLRALTLTLLAYAALALVFEPVNYVLHSARMKMLTYGEVSRKEINEDFFRNELYLSTVKNEVEIHRKRKEKRKTMREDRRFEHKLDGFGEFLTRPADRLLRKGEGLSALFGYDHIYRPDSENKPKEEKQKKSGGKKKQIAV